VRSVLAEYKVHNADVHMRGDYDLDDLVDVIEGSRVYVPAIYVINKIDQASVECSGVARRHRACTVRRALAIVPSSTRRRAPTTPPLRGAFSGLPGYRTSRSPRPTSLLPPPPLQITLEELNVLDRLPHYCPVCAYHEWNLDGLVEMMWQYLDLVRIYTKPKVRQGCRGISPWTWSASAPSPEQLAALACLPVPARTPAYAPWIRASPAAPYVPLPPAGQAARLQRACHRPRQTLHG
jgi:hypothetical protein